MHGVPKINLWRPWQLTLHYDLEVISRVLRLLLSDLQLLLQGGDLLLRLTGHGLLHALDFPRGFDLGLLCSLAGCGDLGVCIGCFPRKTCPSLSSFGKRLQQKQI
jgi:hypothetical protein